ncbi:MAG: rod shape-determining protein MreC [Chloroflexota bacterium]|nr:MAG: rod shape-determining protein MreC [Chloroflexota bacterium]
MVETRSGRRFAAFFLLLAFLVLLLGRWLRPVDDVALTAAAPFAAVASEAASGLGNSVSAVFEGPGLYNENKRLRQKLGRVLTANAQLQFRMRDDIQLRRMMNFETNNKAMQYTAAHVIGVSPDPLTPYIIIDKGRRDGLARYMTVVDQNGYFVGSISDLEGNASIVLVLVNPSSTVGALDLGTKASGVVDGEYGNRAELDYVPMRSALHIGDLIVTSGLMGSYPRGLLLGQISGVTKQNVSLFQTGALRTATDIQSLDMVQVIKSFKPMQLTKLTTP